MSQDPIPYTRRLLDLAARGPDETALVTVSRSQSSNLTRRELAECSLQVARLLQQQGVDETYLVVIALPNTTEHVVATYAAWWLGACVLPLSVRLPDWERERVLDAASSSGRDLFIVGDISTSQPRISPSAFASASHLSVEPFPECVPNPGRAIASGGSTGRPKIIAHARPHVGVPGFVGPVERLIGRRPGQTILTVGPLYHAGPWNWTFAGLFDGGLVVLMEQFDVDLTLDLLEQYQIHALFTAPAQLQRLLSADGYRERDLSSIESLYHSGAPCPAWVKRAWIDRIGADKVFEGYGSSEAVGWIMIRGDAWLKHPGSVGRPEVSDVRICDERGHELPIGEVGEVYMRWTNADAMRTHNGSYTYWGSHRARETAGGFVSVGDLGWLDEGGYLYIADRRLDMIVTGGVNVYPAEVEAALTEHPAVEDVAVVGLADPEWGRRVHAVVESRALGQDLVSDLDMHCRSRLAPQKVPKSYDFVTRLPRNEAGKIRRRDLVREREQDEAAFDIQLPRDRRSCAAHGTPSNGA